MAIRTRATGVAVAVALAAAACQPVDRLDLDEEEPGAPAAPGVPDAAGLPTTLETLLDSGGALARAWQREPVLAEVAVTVDGDRWRRARLLYVAADADRFLSLRFDGARIDQEPVTLETLGLQPMPGDAVADIPPLPGDTLEPAELVDAAQPHLEGCLEGPPSEVIYDTGAPAAWQGDRWADRPMWTATLWHTSGDDGGQARRVDPSSGEPVDDVCARVPPSAL